MKKSFHNVYGQDIFTWNKGGWICQSRSRAGMVDKLKIWIKHLVFTRLKQTNNHSFPAFPGRDFGIFRKSLSERDCPTPPSILSICNCEIKWNDYCSGMNYALHWIGQMIIHRNKSKHIFVVILMFICWKENSTMN